MIWEVCKGIFTKVLEIRDQPNKQLKMTLKLWDIFLFFQPSRMLETNFVKVLGFYQSGMEEDDDTKKKIQFEKI